MNITTDLNHRERQAIAVDLRAHIDSAEKLLVAIETADDNIIPIELIISSLSWGAVVNRIKPAVIDAMTVAKASRELEEEL